MIMRQKIRYLFVYVLYDSLSENVQSFQSTGFPFYNSMAFIVPSMARGRSAFRGTTSNDANSTRIDEEEDLQGTHALY